MKVCSRCSIEKPATTEYYLSDKRLKCGLRAICKQCNKKYRDENKDRIKEYYQLNRETILENKKKYHKENFDSIMEYKRGYYQINRDDILELMGNYYYDNSLERKKYRDNNKDRIALVGKRYRNKNKNKIAKREREYFKKRLKDDLEFKLLNACRSRFHKALKGKRKASKSIELVGCSMNELKRHLENQFADGMTWDNYGQWHIDHIVPCASFDFTKEEEQFQCFNYKNLQPLWAEDNWKKSDKMPEQFNL